MLRLCRGGLLGGWSLRRRCGCDLLSWLWRQCRGGLLDRWLVCWLLLRLHRLNRRGLVLLGNGRCRCGRRDWRRRWLWWWSLGRGRW